MPAPIWNPPGSGASQPDMSAYLAQVTGNSNPDAFSNSVTGQAAQQRNALGQFPVTSYTGDGSPLVDIGGGMKMNVSNGQVYGDSGPILDASGSPLKYSLPVQKNMPQVPGSVNDYLNSLGGPTSNVNDYLNSLALGHGVPISSQYKGYTAPNSQTHASTATGGSSGKTTFNYLGKQYEYDPSTGKYNPVASTTPPPGGGTNPPPPPTGGGTGTNDFMTMLEGMIPGISKNPGALYQLLMRSLFGMQGGGGGFGGYGTPSYGMAGNPMQAFLKFFSSQVPQGY